MTTKTSTPEPRWALVHLGTLASVLLLAAIVSLGHLTPNEPWFPPVLFLLANALMLAVAFTGFAWLNDDRDTLFPEIEDD